MSGGRVRSLDGVRGIAILCVLLGHTNAALSPHHRIPAWLPVPSGNFGVQVFFVLSGFLITTLLVSRPDDTLRAFYRRRAWRILPPFAVMLAVAIPFVTRAQWLSAATFTWNYSPAAGGWWLGHTWSLAIEEQFYLLWPLLLLRLGRDRSTRALAVFVAAAPVLRVATYVLVPALRGHVSAMFHTRGDALAIGCLLALLAPTLQRHAHRVALAYLPVSWWLAARYRTTWLLPLGYTLDAVAVAVLIRYAMQHPPRWLTSKALVHVGLVSYSLYLWQQWFLHPGLPVVLGLAAAFAAAEASYWLVERSANRFKVRSCLRIMSRSPGISHRRAIRPSDVLG